MLMTAMPLCISQVRRLSTSCLHNGIIKMLPVLSPFVMIHTIHVCTHDDYYLQCPYTFLVQVVKSGQILILIKVFTKEVNSWKQPCTGSFIIVCLFVRLCTIVHSGSIFLPSVESELGSSSSSSVQILSALLISDVSTSFS